jgi:hypothetical protein
MGVNPEDEDGDGPRNVGLFMFKPLDAADSPRRFYNRCETWSFIVREEHRLWVLEKRVLRRIFGAN